MSDHPWVAYDLLATFADLAGAPAPATDGISLRPLLEGRAQEQHEYLYWERFRAGAPTPLYLANDRGRHGHFVQAVRKGRWKCLRWAPGTRSDGSVDVNPAGTREVATVPLVFVPEEAWEVELYDLVADPGETTNLAPLQPAIVDELVAHMQAAHVDPATAGGSAMMFALTRRHVLQAAAGAAVAALGRGLPASAAAGDRPNILWLVSEDSSPLIGAYGDTVARTPAIDGLATEGVRFDVACSTAPVCAPSRYAILTGMHAESCAPAQHMRASGHIPDWLRGFPAYLRDAGYYTTNSAKTDYNAPFDAARAGWNLSRQDAHWRNRPTPERPFFAVFNFDTSHETGMFAGARVLTDPATVRIPAYLPDTPVTRMDRAHQYDLLQLTDALIAQRLDELDADGLADDTIVLYYGDHGGLVPRSKRFCYDSGLRVPLIARFPEKWAHLAPAGAGGAVTTPVSLVDLAPTMLALAGIALPGHLHGVPFAGDARQERRYVFSGRGRMDERYDHVRTARDERYRYVRNAMPHLPNGQHVLFMWGQASYRDWEQRFLDGTLDEVQSRFWRERPAEELYDLVDDPDEVVNLADDDAHAEALERLRLALDAHLLAVHDNGYIPESSPLEGYDASRAPGAYPLEQAIALAQVAARRDPTDVPQLVDATTDASEVLRWWGALGLAAQAEAGLPADAVGALQLALRTDASIPVRITAAEALGRAGVLDEALPYLAGVVDAATDVRHQLQALNALTAIGDPARAVLPSVARGAASSDEYVRNAGKYLAQRLTGAYVPMP